MKITLVKTFKEGDVICLKRNFDNDIFFFSKATQNDVKEYSGKQEYYKIENVESSRNEKTIKPCNCDKNMCVKQNNHYRFCRYTQTIVDPEYLRG